MVVVVVGEVLFLVTSVICVRVTGHRLQFLATFIQIFVYSLVLTGMDS